MNTHTQTHENTYILIYTYSQKVNGQDCEWKAKNDVSNFHQQKVRIGRITNKHAPLPLTLNLSWFIHKWMGDTYTDIIKIAVEISRKFLNIHKNVRTFCDLQEIPQRVLRAEYVSISEFIELMKYLYTLFRERATVK